MSLRIVLAASAALTLATPAFAQQAPAAPPAPPAAPAPAPAPTPEEQAIMVRVEAAGEALQEVMEDLEPRAAAVRADASLSAADKEIRIRAMIAEHPPVLDEFNSALQGLMRITAAAEGASPEEAAPAAAMVSTMVSAQITQALVTGEDPDGE